MKPKEQKSQAVKQAKGLARWGWVKRYLGPAMKFTGITSLDFDKIIMGGDQFIKSDRTQSKSGFPTPDIEINGVTYTPTGAPGPGQEPSFPGYWCIVFTWTPTVETFDTEPTPDVSRFGGAITMNSAPEFVMSNQTNALHFVGLSTGATAAVTNVIPLAYFSEDGVLTKLFTGSRVQFFAQGGNIINAWAQ